MKVGVEENLKVFFLFLDVLGEDDKVSMSVVMPSVQSQYGEEVADEPPSSSVPLFPEQMVTVDTFQDRPINQYIRWRFKRCRYTSTRRTQHRFPSSAIHHQACKESARARTRSLLPPPSSPSVSLSRPPPKLTQRALSRRSSSPSPPTSTRPSRESPSTQTQART